jgi:D-arabinose 1-dehydrogenase-like Zn-dependent alcohol dehydrogenase
VAPLIEQMPMADVNKAIRRLNENRARYRIVLDNDIRN